MRRYLLHTLGTLGVVLCVVGFAVQPAHAQAPIDLAAALAAAAPGATITLPAGVYPGPLALDKPVTLLGEPGAIIEGTGQGDVISVNAPDVTLRGLVVRNSGDSLDRENSGVVAFAPRLTVEDVRVENTLFGIYLKNAPNSVIRNNTVLSKELEVARRGDGIRVWYSDATVVEGNHVIGSRDVVMWFSNRGTVRHNRVENGRYGLHFMFANEQIIEDNELLNNSVGIYLMYGRYLELRHNWIENNHGPSGYGLGLKDVDDVIVEDNQIVANRVGAYVDNSPREADAIVRFERNLFAYNEIGVTMLPVVQRNTFTANTFQDNAEQIAVAGSGDLTRNHWAEGEQGNYWSDYAGFDADGDQIGDLPYAASSFYESLLGLYPELRLFQLSPAVQALDLAARAFPVFQPRPKMADPYPLMAPPVMAWPQASTGASSAVWWIAAGLVLVGLAVVMSGVAPWRNVR
jgi:nitrous oxidase accessory protein